MTTKEFMNLAKDIAEQFNSSHENECFNVVKRLCLKHGIDVILPVLQALEVTMDEEMEYGEPERLL